MAGTSLNPSDVNKLVLEAFTSGWMTYEPRYGYIFGEQEPQRVDEKFSITSSGGNIAEVAEGASFPQVNISEAGSKTISQRVFKEGLPVTTLLQRFDNYGVVREEAQKLGYRARLTMDQIGADVLNNAFGSTTTWDGQPLYSASHSVGSTGTTQDNLETGQLTETTMNTAITTLRNMKDQNGQKMALRPRTLVVSPTFQKKAFELTASQGSPETANRYSNFFNTLGLQVIVWELLTDTDAWFLFADKMFTRLRYLVSIPPKIEYVRRPESGNYEYQLEFACNADAVDYLGTVASAGA